MFSLSVLVTLLLAAPAAADQRTALDRYVAAPDPNYKFELVNTIRGEGYTAYVLDMISQAWRTPQEVDRTLWQHWVTVIKPDRVTTSIGLLFIAGGSNGGKPPARSDAMLTHVALGTGAVVTELRMVPNQPLSFAGDFKPRRVEDELIAYTWDKYLRGGDDQWPARLPMTKAAVRAMDTVTAFCAREQSGGVKVDRFVVAGGSKRGWTAWTTAVVDRRVVAVTPLVIDLLNVEKSFIHHWRAYGFWSPAIKDYVEMEITSWMGKPKYAELMKIEEPYEYRDRLTMPKYLINASGDEFFLPDSSQFYFDELRGEKYLRYVPNTGHSLRGTDAAAGMEAYFHAIVHGTPRPKFSWKMERSGSIQVKAVDQPAEVKLWQATNAKARDFRLVTIGPAWKSTPLAENEGTYTASVERPPEGWTAFFVELTWPGGGKHPLKFTTPVRVVPDVLPFPPPR